MKDVLFIFSFIKCFLFHHFTLRVWYREWSVHHFEVSRAAILSAKIFDLPHQHKALTFNTIMSSQLKNSFEVRSGYDGRTLKQPLSRELIIQTKLCFKLLQAVHHSEVVDDSLKTNSFPPGMFRQVGKLTNFIKPSSPTEETAKQVHINTLEWMHNNMVILRTHYDTVIANILNLLTACNPLALQRAIMWAKTKYRHKLTNSTVTTVGTMVSNLEKGIAEAPTPTVQAPINNTRNTLRVEVQVEHQKATQPLSLTSRPSFSVGYRAPKTNVAVYGGDDISADPSQTQQSLNQTRTNPIVHRTALTENNKSNTEHMGNISVQNKGLALQTNNVLLDSLTDIPQGLSQVEAGGEATPVLPIPNIKGEMMNGNEKKYKLSDSIPELSPPNIKEDEENVSLVVSLQPPQLLTHSTQLTENTDPNIRVLVPADDSLSSEDVSERSEPVILLKPHRHPNTDHKIRDWSLTIKKPIVIVGDSNLSRIPYFTNTSIQIDSFPGANFLHIGKILGKLQPNPFTQKVILSVGINNKDQQPHKTATKQLQQMWGAAKTAFPNATVYTPIIHFSDRLTTQQQNNLKIINTYIEKNGCALLELNNLRFQVEARDNIHWTGATAVQILEFWLQQLNY